MSAACGARANRPREVIAVPYTRGRKGKERRRHRGAMSDARWTTSHDSWPLERGSASDLNRRQPRRRRRWSVTRRNRAVSCRRLDVTAPDCVASTEGRPCHTAGLRQSILVYLSAAGELFCRFYGVSVGLLVRLSLCLPAAETENGREVGAIASNTTPRRRCISCADALQLLIFRSYI